MSTETTRLEHLFDMELEYRQGMKPVYSDRGKLGEYLGSGEGAIFGPKINGIVRWDLYEEEDQRLCGSNLRGMFKTDDGATIKFDSVGFFLRPDRSLPTRWLTSASVNFATDDPLYRWLNDVLGIWHGVFDMGTYRHSYRVFAQIIESSLSF